MRYIVLFLVIASKAYSFCINTEAQVTGVVTSVLETKTSCHYEVKISNNNAIKLCTLTTKEIESTTVAHKKVFGQCEFSIGQTFSRSLTFDKNTEMIIID